MDIIMPALSPTMEKGTLAKWLVERGDRISPGQLLAEIETDKATMELEAFDPGVITRLLIAAGTEDVPVGTVIATLDTEADGDAAPVAGDPPALMEAQSQPQALPAKNPPVPAVAGASASESSDGAIDVSPLAARLARAVGRDLAGVRGSGPAGRILKRDVIADAPSVPVLSDMSPAVPPHFAVRTEAPHESVRLSAMRKVIATRLAESKRTIPHFYLSINCRLDALLGLRGDLNRELSHRGIKLSVTDFLVRAFAVALERVPDANVQFTDDALLRFSRVDLSLAVAVDGGLVTPVIRDAGGKSLTAIAGEAQRLAGLARQGELSPEDYQGGTASLSNLGMFGVDAIGPVINPPQAVILGIGASEKRVIVIDGEAAIATVLTATASFDHRAIDGAAGAKLMAAFRAVVEAPMELLV